MKTARYTVKIDHHRKRINEPSDMIKEVVDTIKAGCFERIDIFCLESPSRSQVITKDDGCLCRIETITTNRKTGEVISSLQRITDDHSGRINAIIGGHFIG